MTTTIPLPPGLPVATGVDANPVIRWLMTEGRKAAGSNEFLEGFAACLRRAGIEVTRMTTGVPILHPQIF
jgi:adenylate cyclase